jgi:hypothetical protein
MPSRDSVKRGLHHQLTMAPVMVTLETQNGDALTLAVFREPRDCCGRVLTLQDGREGLPADPKVPVPEGGPVVLGVAKGALVTVCDTDCRKSSLEAATAQPGLAAQGCQADIDEHRHAGRNKDLHEVVLRSPLVTDADEPDAYLIRAHGGTVQTPDAIVR